MPGRSGKLVDVGEERRDFLRVELLFLALFAFGVWARAINPDLWAPAFGGEKPMDFAYLNSVMGADALPPADPWFSGGRMNYYYFGWMLVAGLAKLSGVPAALAYNLALATWFALIGVGAFSLAWNLWLSGVAKGSAVRGAWIAGVAALSFLPLVVGLYGLDVLGDAGVVQAYHRLPGTLQGQVSLLQGGYEVWLNRQG